MRLAALEQLAHRHEEPGHTGRPSQPVRQAGLGGPAQRGPSDAWVALVLRKIGSDDFCEGGETGLHVQSHQLLGEGLCANSGTQASLSEVTLDLPGLANQN